MSLSINDVYSEKSYASDIKTGMKRKIKGAGTQKSEDKSSSSHKFHKKKQILSEIEGKYLCTYIVDEEGQKLLLAKVPIFQLKNQINLLEQGNSKEAYPNDYSLLANSIDSFNSNKKLNLECAYKRNSRNTLGFLENNNNDLLKLKQTILSIKANIL